MENSSFTFSSKRTLIILAIIIAVIWGASWVTRNGIAAIDNNHIMMESLRRLITPESEYDVVFLGDSRAHEGNIPQVFTEEIKELTGEEMTAVNLAAPAMQPPFSYLITKRYIETAKKTPKVVFLDYSFYLLGGRDQWLKDLYLSYYTPSLAEALDLYVGRVITARQAVAWYVTTRIPLLRHRKKIQSMVDELINKPDFLLSNALFDADLATILYDKKNLGYMSMGATAVPIAQLGDGYRSDYEVGYEHYLEYFEKLFYLANKNRIHLVLYEFPWPEPLNTPSFRKLLKHYQDLIQARSANNPYVHFYFDIQFWPNVYFANQQHTNQTGAERLTRQLARYYHTNVKPTKTDFLPAPPYTPIRAAQRATNGNCPMMDAIRRSQDQGEVYYIAERSLCIWHYSKQEFSMQQAQDYCKEFGAALCDDRQLGTAQSAGLEWCSWGWTENTNKNKAPMVSYPMQRRDDPKCGNSVLPYMYPSAKSRFGVNCCYVRP